MRIITDHITNPANDRIRIEVQDEPGAGGANHRYHISGFNSENNPGHCGLEGTTEKVILFQNGPIKEAGVNGITHEVLLAICIDRLRSFQNGPYSCKANACALTHLEAALMWLQQRTLERMWRGVEGTHAK